MSKIGTFGTRLFGANSMGGVNGVITYEGLHSFTQNQKVIIEGFKTPGFNVVGQKVTTIAERALTVECFKTDDPNEAFGLENDGMMFRLASASIKTESESGVFHNGLVEYILEPYAITAASAMGGMVTYVCDNDLMMGQVISITGFSDNTTYNVNNAQIMSVTPTQFTVASMDTVGSTSDTGIVYPVLYEGQNLSISGFSQEDSINESFNVSGVIIHSVEIDRFYVVSQLVTGTTNSGGTARLNVNAYAYLDVNPDTTYLYKNIPDYIQEWDSGNSFQLASWLDGCCSILQPIDNLVRDTKTDVGWSLLFDVNKYSKLTNLEELNNALAILPWFAQFVGTKLPIIPHNVLHTRNIVSDLRFVQFVQPYIDKWINQIKYFNSFERGTVSSFIHSLALFLTEMNNLSTVIPIEQLQVLERTNVVWNPTLQYVSDPYSILVLVPRQYLLTGTYGNIYVISNNYYYYNTGDPTTSRYPYYNNIPATIVASEPSPTTFFGEFLKTSIPAGIKVNVLPI